MPEKKATRLKRSWAHAFRTVILPLIDEEAFREAFHDSNGRPNKSILLLMGAHILKHWNDLTDAQVIEQVEFNLQWQYALNLTAEDAHLVQRTMHSFRQLLLENDRARQMFDDITRKLAAADGIVLGHQRLDSTHVISNIAVLTRLTLFVETVTKFLRELRSELPERLDDVAAAVRRRYLEREGYFNDAKREQAKRRLPVVAQDIHGLIELFSGDDEVSEMPAFSLLRRLFSEQCELVDEAHAGTDDDAGDGASATSSDEQKVVVKLSKPKTVSNSSLQGPHNPDAADAGSDDGADAKPAATSSNEQEAVVKLREPEVVSSSSPQSPHNPDAADANTDDGPNAEPAATSSNEQEAVVKLREPKTVSSGSLQSPHDPDATYGHKGKGYEVQISETCDDENAYQLITLVNVNGANESDQNQLVPLLDQLQTSGLAPSELLADTGYGSGKNIVEAGKRGVLLVAPVPDPKAPKPPDPFLQSSDDSAEKTPAPAALEPPVTDEAPAPTPLSSFDYAAFTFGANYTTVVCCPADHSPDGQRFDGKMLLATFTAAQCGDCPLALHCPTRQLNDGRRQLHRASSTLATECRQFEQQTSTFKERYKKRGGVEATNSVLKGPHGLRDLRVRGKSRVGLAATMKALALNTKRAAQYHVGLLTSNVEPCMA